MERGRCDNEVVSDYFNAWFAAGKRHATFLKKHSVDQQTMYSRNPRGAIAIYKDAPQDIKERFAALSVERQMAILLVPVRGQARYKKSGVDAYIAWKEATAPEKRPRAIGKGVKAAEKLNLNC